MAAMENPNIVWQDPPRPSSKWFDRLVPLTECPGKWALLGSFGPDTISNPRTSEARGLSVPAGQWEFANRTVSADGSRPPVGKVWLYARFVGSGE